MALNSAYILNGLNVNVKGMEAALVNYVKNPQEKGFDIKSIPVDTQVSNDLALCAILIDSNDFSNG